MDADGNGNALPDYTQTTLLQVTFIPALFAAIAAYGIAVLLARARLRQIRRDSHAAAPAPGPTSAAFASCGMIEIPEASCEPSMPTTAEPPRPRLSKE